MDLRLVAGVVVSAVLLTGCNDGDTSSTPSPTPTVTVTRPVMVTKTVTRTATVSVPAPLPSACSLAISDVQALGRLLGSSEGVQQQISDLLGDYQAGVAAGQGVSSTQQRIIDLQDSLGNQTLMVTEKLDDLKTQTRECTK